MGRDSFDLPMFVVVFFNDYLQLQILFNDKLMIKLNKRISSQERNGDKKIKKKKWANNLYLFIDLL